MKKKLVTVLFMCMTLVTGCAKSEAPVEKIENFELNTTLSSNDDVKQEHTTNLLDDFLAGKISADGNGLYVTDTLHISELQMDEEEWDSYHIGERLDLDNDGEDEQILTGPYGDGVEISEQEYQELYQRYLGE